MTIQDILSEIQVNLKDISFEKITEAEYLDMSVSILNDLAKDSKIWMARKLFVPDRGTSSWDIALAYAIGDIVFDASNVYYRAIANVPINTLLTDMSFWLPINYPIHFIDVNFDVHGTPFAITRIVRYSSSLGVRECNEFSLRSIAQQTSDNLPFDINTNSLGATDYAVKFIDAFGRLKSMTIIFGDSFEVNEQVYIDFIQNSPVKLTSWQNTGAKGNYSYDIYGSNIVEANMTIPEFMSEALEAGIMYKAMKKLIFRGYPELSNMLSLYKEEYEKSRLQVSSLSHHYKTGRSSILIQPINWLGSD